MLERILDLMKRRGISASELAEKLGMNRSLVSEWTSGKTRSYNKYLPQIAEVLGVSVEDLYPAEGDALSDDERDMLRIYRRLPERKQGIIVGRMLEMLEPVGEAPIEENKKGASAS